jgi:hypothetical protein
MVRWRKPRAREVSPPRPAAWIARQRSRATTARRPATDGDNSSATAQPGEGNTARGIGDGSGARTMAPNVIAGIDQPCSRVSRGRTPRHSLSFLRIKIARCTNRGFVAQAQSAAAPTRDSSMSKEAPAAQSTLRLPARLSASPRPRPSLAVPDHIFLSRNWARRSQTT